MDAVRCLGLGVYQSIHAYCALELARECAWAGGSMDGCLCPAPTENKLIAVPSASVPQV